MKIAGAFVVLLVFLVAACSTLSPNASGKQQAELVENGYLAMSAGDYGTAEILLKRALDINEKNPYALLNLGVVYQETGRYEKARQAYQSVIDINPSQTAASTNVEGYSGQNLADIAKVNLGNLPPPPPGSSYSGMRNDADQDGVSDYMDRCKYTPPGASVTSDGCWALIDIFASGKYDIHAKAYEQLNAVVKILKENPSMRLVIQGHTDNSGSAESNQILSEKRAKSVKDYLVGKGIELGRLQWVGYGQSRPIVSNTTAEGRKRNRRVDLVPIP